MSLHELGQVLLEFEQELLTPKVRASNTRLNELLADEFVEFGSSGRTWDKQSIIDELTQQETAEKFQVENFNVVSASDDTALLTYLCIVRSASDEVLRKSNRSSLWKLIDGSWKLVFHQGTNTK